MSELFWSSLGLLAYTFAGYPLLIAGWARLAPRPVLRETPGDPGRLRIAVVLVVHDEAARLSTKLATLLAQRCTGASPRIVVASDGSTDATADIARAHADRGVHLLAFPTRRGKAACLNDAVAACDEEIIVFTDARQALNPDAVRYLAENFADPSVGAVSGELVFVGDDPTPFAGGVDAYWRYEKFIRQREARVHSVPGATGALYAIRRECFRPIPPGTILDDVAIPMQAVMTGRRAVFDGRAQAYDRASRAPAEERLRKVRTLAGNYQLLQVYPRLLSPLANPIWLQFVSHKVLRLAAPFAMLALLLSDAALATTSVAYAVFLAAQLVFYAMAALGATVPRIGRLRIPRIASAFVLLNAFAFLGLLQFLAQRDAHLWTSRPKERADSSAGG